MSETEVAVIWRNDGVINYIIPPSTLVNTFFATVLAHDKWLCQLVNEFTDATKNDNPALTDKQVQIIDIIKQGLAGEGGAHGNFDATTSRLKKGTDDFYPGMFYGTMHPTELAVLADKVEEVMEIADEMGLVKTDKGRQHLDTIMCWRDAAKKFVRTSEAMSTLMAGVGKA